MLLELTMIMFITAYLSIVALGHVLLFTAIFKCWREDLHGGTRAPDEREVPSFKAGSKPVVAR
jgi:hypothetical protein